MRRSKARFGRLTSWALRDMDSFLIYLDGFVTFVPTEHELPTALKLYYIVNQAPGDQLNRDKSFSTWMKKLIEAWGQFLDTPASASGISSFVAQPNYNIGDYFVGPSGWLTFNQFFAREVKPGKRPIAEPNNDRLIVSPADATFAGKWDIDANSKVTVKGISWPLAQLLDGSPYQNAFKDGIFAHMFLHPGDYHRYHVPVAGEIKEVRNIHGRVYMDVARRPDGTLYGIDGENVPDRSGTRVDRHRLTRGGAGGRATGRDVLRFLGQSDARGWRQAAEGRRVRILSFRRL